MVGIKMPASEREDGQVLVLSDRWQVLDLFKGHMGSPCEEGKYKGLNHYRQGIFTILGVDKLAQGTGTVLGEYRIQGLSFLLQLLNSAIAV